MTALNTKPIVAIFLKDLSDFADKIEEHFVANEKLSKCFEQNYWQFDEPSYNSIRPKIDEIDRDFKIMRHSIKRLVDRASSIGLEDGCGALQDDYRWLLTLYFAGKKKWVNTNVQIKQMSR